MAEDYYDKPDGAEMQEDALRGLSSGDLQPLVAYLRSPFPLRAAIRRALVKCIEGGDLYTVYIKKTRAGRPPGSIRADFFNLDIQAFMDEKIAASVKPKEAVHQAIEKFKVSQSTIYAQWNEKPRKIPKK